MEAGDGSVKWTRLGSRRLLSSPVFDLAEVEDEGPGGRKGRFVVLEARDWAAVVPLVRHGGRDCFIMVRQYRHGSDEISVEFPGGVVEAGEEPAAAAARELAEETGYAAAALRLAGVVSPNPAIMANRFHVFLAEGLVTAGETSLDEHEAIDLLFVPVAEARASMGRGEFSHGLMDAALFMAERLLAEEGPA
jgi:ADP-ribose pyrophosphatase